MLDLNQESLRGRIEELEEENRQLKDLLSPPVSFPIAWRLSPQECRLLSALFTHERLSHDVARAALQSRSDTPCQSLVSANICHLRRKLKPMGIEIINIAWFGYAITQASRPIIRGALHETDSYRRSLLGDERSNRQTKTAAHSEHRTKAGAKVRRMVAA